MFKIICKLAINNAFLRLSRTLLVILMISISMAMMISIQGLYDGMTLSMSNNIKHSDSGEISMYAKGYRLNKTIMYTIKNSEKIKSTLKKDPSIKAIALRTSVEGLSFTARKSAFSSIIGIDLNQEEEFGNFSKFLTKGKLSFKNSGALIGYELAKTLKIKIGSKVIFSTQNSSGEISALAVRIRGIIQTSNISLDAFAIYVNRKKLNNFLEINLNQATQIAIRTKNQVLKKELVTTYPFLEVKSFLELYPMIKQMKDIMVIFNSITFFIVMLVVFIGILAVMYVSILDRTREFGILKSIGMSYKFIRFQIILEALLIGFSGYAIGAILGLISLLFLHYMGLDFSWFKDGMQSFGIGTVLYANIKLSYFTNTFMAIMAASFFSVFLPLRKIKILNPIEVIKVNS